MQVPVSSIPSELIRELRERKWLSFFLFAFVSLSVLVVGLIWPQKYQSTLTIFADDQNIIRPLMEGSAVTTKITDRASAAKETLFSRRVLFPLVENVDVWGGQETTKIQKEQKLAQLRSAIIVKNKGKNYFSIQYRDSDPSRTFLVTQKLGQLFIQETGAEKKEESRSAYSFVDKQVKVYQTQLKVSEDKLKYFLSENVDGTEASVNMRLSDLRTQIEQAELERDEQTTKKTSVSDQIKRVSKTVKQESVGSAIKLRINALETRLETLRLNYHDSYPDVIVLKKQIADLKSAVEEESGNKTTSGRQETELIVNPLHQELQSALAKTQTRIKTIDTRIDSLNTLLKQEYARMERIQSNKAKLAELTRDNTVNQGIYNDLLKRREKARVSMHLDIEGQGLSYKIHEPADFPLGPIGFKFLHFAIAGLILGLLTPIALLIVYLQVDPRVRIASVFEENTGIHVLTSIPHVTKPIEHRKNRIKTLFICFLGVVVVAIYCSITWLKLSGGITL